MYMPTFSFIKETREEIRILEQSNSMQNVYIGALAEVGRSKSDRRCEPVVRHDELHEGVGGGVPKHRQEPCQRPHHTTHVAHNQIALLLLLLNSPFGKRCFLRSTSGDAPLHQRMVAEVVPP